MAATLTPPPLTMTDSPTTPRSLLTRLTSPFATQRARKQASLFCAGAFFFMLSGAVTRRALLRRHLATVPRRFTPSNEPNRNFSGPIEAAEALGLATINVTSAALMLGGGALWAFDISTLDEMRRIVRGGLGVDGTGRDEKEVEEDFEEWMATVLNRKEMKDAAKGQHDQESK